MGTNYYARILPKRERKENLKKLIEEDAFKEIAEEVDNMYRRFSTYNKNSEPQGEIHLGKASGGWKFLWNPNIYLIRNGHMEYTKNSDGNKSHKYVSEPNSAYYVYPLTKKGIKDFIDRDDVEIYNEYEEKQDKEKFWFDALNSTEWFGKEAWDSKSYDEWEKERTPEYKPHVSTGEYIDLLKAEGFKMASYTNSDFYSDGLRFATCNDFC